MESPALVKAGLRQQRHGWCGKMPARASNTDLFVSAGPVTAQRFPRCFNLATGQIIGYAHFRMNLPVDSSRPTLNRNRLLALATALGAVLLMATVPALFGGGSAPALPSVGSGRNALPFALGSAPPAFRGQVQELLPAGGYLYLRVADRWVATIKKPIAVGDQVDVKPIGLADNFNSKTLRRTFSPLVFGIVSNTKPKTNRSPP
jgi:hypothetical protein